MTSPHPLLGGRSASMSSLAALGAASGSNWRPNRLNRDKCLSLEQITEGFSAPITEEHAFAIVHECMKTLTVLVTRSHPAKKTLATIEGTRDIFLHNDGRVHESTFIKAETAGRGKAAAPAASTSTNTKGRGSAIAFRSASTGNFLSLPCFIFPASNIIDR